MIHIPTSSWWPFLAAAALAVVCVSLLVRVYWVAALATLVATLLLLRWSWENGAHPRAAADGRVAEGYPPLHSRTLDGPGRWCMGIALLANGSLLLSLLFGWFYLWTVSPEWRMPEASPLSLSMLLAAGALLTLGWLGFERLVRALCQRRDRGLGPGLYAVAALGGLHLLGVIALLWQAPIAPTDNAHDAVLCVALIYLMIHAGLATVLALLQALRVGYGYVGAELPYEPRVVVLLWRYLLGAYWLLAASLWLLPTLLGGGA